MWMFAGLALLALAVAPKDRLRKVGLGDAGDAEIAPREADLPSSSEVFLLRPEDFAFPAQKAAIAARGEENGSRWVVAPASGWAGSKPFATARQARTVLKAAGFKGPYGHGQSSRWTRG